MRLIYNHREDLQFWLQENMSDLKLGAPDCLEKHNEIKQTVASVKAQEDQLMDRLRNEQICLERELQIGKWLRDHCKLKLDA